MPKLENHPFRTRFAELAEAWRGNGGAWHVGSRERALARFEELGLPTRRQEEWKYTDLTSLGKLPFRAGRGVAPSAEALQALQVAGLEGPRLVFVDGRLHEELSSLQELPDGVRAGSLAAAAAADEPGVRDLLEQDSEWFADHPFAALNRALWEDGLCIRVPRGVRVEQPLHVLFVGSPGAGDPVASHPRLLVVLDEGAALDLVEDHAAVDGTQRLTNLLGDFRLARDARLEHCRILREADTCWHISALESRQETGSYFASHAFTLGGALVRNDVNSVLAAEHAECTLNGLVVGRDRQHIDNHTRIEHARPDCRSWEFYKAILADQSTGVFNGKIYVHPVAQKTDAKQTNQSLLLSDDATMNSKPELEIYADDVKCTHGATIGHLDETALFYLRTRGINRETAKSILTWAFSSEIIETVGIEPLRQLIESHLYERLPQAGALRQTT